MTFQVGLFANLYLDNAIICLLLYRDHEKRQNLFSNMQNVSQMVLPGNYTVISALSANM